MRFIKLSIPFCFFILFIQNNLVLGKTTFGQQDSQIFRAWFVRIISEQLRVGPTPKWPQRDCVGLIRFSATESLKQKTLKWIKSHGVANRPLPPEYSLPWEKRRVFGHWVQYDGKSKDSYVSAIGLIQNNAVFVSKNINLAKKGDLLFFDMQDSQHLMVWMGNHLAYHTGSSRSDDNGLRKLSFHELLTWKDTRWRPHKENPNFIGIFKFSFLSH